MLNRIGHVFLSAVLLASVALGNAHAADKVINFGTEVLSVVMLKMWVGGKPEEVSVIGLVMLVLVLLFRWVQLKFIKKRISTL